jgi:hypothetical protein
MTFSVQEIFIVWISACCQFLLSSHFSAIRLLRSFGNLRPFGFVLIRDELFHAESGIPVVNAFSSF